MLRWTNLSKSYGRRRLFSELSGSVEPGAALLVLGRNGSGKSTFLKILVGLARPDIGQVERPDASDAIGYAAPHMAFYGELTGLENLTFLGSLRGMRDSDHAAQLLDRLNLKRAANRSVATYSTGMTQRLRIAAALLHSPATLILDEPTIGLDQEGVLLVEQVVSEHLGGGGAAIVATNDEQQFAGIEQKFGGTRLTMGA